MCAILMTFFGMDNSRAWAMLVTLIIAIAKEVTDYLINRKALQQNLTKPHSVEVLDVVTTVVGAGICWSSAVFSE